MTDTVGAGSSSSSSLHAEEPGNPGLFCLRLDTSADQSVLKAWKILSDHMGTLMSAKNRDGGNSRRYTSSSQK